MAFRTDLAVELKPDIDRKTGGVSAHREHYGEMEITTIVVENEIGERLLGKPKGRYISIALPPFLEDADSPMVQSIIAARLKKLLPKTSGTALVVGLGNCAVTPDALGPQTAERVLATRHIRAELGEVEGLEDLQPVAVFSPGVLGKTGIETLELIRGAVQTVKPAFVIAVDAFAARESERLGNTVQLASSGICPGSGVGNSRKALDQNSLGVPVISIGVPTVVDASTLLADTAGESAAARAKPFGKEMFVTPREIDMIIERASKLLARVLNAVLQPAYSAEQIQSLMA
ncbi:MAG: GPR endopeptidase [Ruminococcaceae bacterium]|nr:GPR endopeptidase [Oscillospiraceae bacterium]